ncbi:MAG: class I SAM-dependent methyltransferase [Bacteroidales bacterium]|jgi:SAM-dependent methyltransferase|nr:class I SAM-dependent methyltransferase [Bacteroidales bacterium]
MKYECRICEKEVETEPIFLKEMQLGLLDTFEYFKCPSCGCIQIKDIPTDMTKYYPNNYYSFRGIYPNKHINFIRRRLMHDLFSYRMGKFNLMGAIFYNIIPNYPYKWIEKGIVDYNSSILDVGCGRGERLFKMKEGGFKKLLGIDPFLPQKEIKYKNGLIIQKKQLYEIKNKYDFIMLHHSLEHIAEQEKTLMLLKNIMKEDGALLIRILVCEGKTVKEYKLNAFHLESPRHFYIHSMKSISYLADKLDFSIIHYYYDTHYSNILASEMYRRGIYEEYRKDLFTKKEIFQAKRQIKISNRNNDGDTISIILKNRNK